MACATHSAFVRLTSTHVTRRTRQGSIIWLEVKSSRWLKPNDAALTSAVRACVRGVVVFSQHLVGFNPHNLTSHATPQKHTQPREASCMNLKRASVPL
jgi:hypothetical protein